MAHAQSKRFEAALRIPERHPRRQANYQIENATTLFAAPRLMHADQAAVQRSRSKRDVTLSIRSRLDQLLFFGNGRRQIGVGKQRDITARGLKPEPHCSAFAEI